MTAPLGRGGLARSGLVGGLAGSGLIGGECATTWRAWSGDEYGSGESRSRRRTLMGRGAV